MKLTSALKLVFASLAGLCTAHAQSSATWSAAAGIFTLSNQPGYTANVGGSLLPDAGSDPSVSLTVSGATSGGLYGDYFYALFSNPTFTLASAAISDLGTITLEITTGGFAFLAAPTLDFGSITGLAVTPTTTDVGNTDYGNLTRYTYVWDLSSVVSSAVEFTLTWQLNNHAPIAEISLQQTPVPGGAIPEPSAFAALAGLGALGLAATRRRHRS